MRESSPPTAMLAVLGLLVSLFGNYVQYRNNQEQLVQQARANEEQLAQERAKWADERLKIQAELNDLQERQAITAITRSALLRELNQVNQYIVSWNGRIANDQIERQVQVEVLHNRTPTPDEYKQITAIDNDIADAQNKRLELLSRRRELEAYFYATTPK